MNKRDSVRKLLITADSRINKLRLAIVRRGLALCISQVIECTNHFIFCCPVFGAFDRSGIYSDIIAQR